MRHLRDVNGKWAVREDVKIRYKFRDKVRLGDLTVGYTGYGGGSHIGPECQFGLLADAESCDPAGQCARVGPCELHEFRAQTPQVLMSCRRRGRLGSTIIGAGSGVGRVAHGAQVSTASPFQRLS